MSRASVFDPSVRRRVLLGRSVEGRPIYALELGDADNERRTLVVGVIHGNETAGLSIAHDLAKRHPPKEALLWIVGKLNPDGVAAGTRQNAHGVDLNRNFPWRWRPLGVRGDLQYSGPRPLSEPESRLARSLILRVRPRITIWFHQPLGLVDESGGNLAVERRFARIAHLPLQRLTRYPGSAAGWQNHRLPRSTAFVAELPPGTPSARRASGYARAVLKLAS
jgi:protein MpaA